MRRVSLAARHERRQRNALRLSRGGLDAVGVVHAGVIQSQCRGNNVINRDPASYRQTSGRAKLPSASYRIGSSAGPPRAPPGRPRPCLRCVPAGSAARSCASWVTATGGSDPTGMILSETI